MHIPPRSRGLLKRRAKRSYLTRHVLLPAQTFVHTEEASGLLLLTAALGALVWSNSPWSISYDHFWTTVITIDLGLFSLSETLRHWVNDGLMTIFFFVAGLEIKRELVHGILSEPRQAALPVIAALGGMLLPAFFFLALNTGTESAKG